MTLEKNQIMKHRFSSSCTWYRSFVLAFAIALSLLTLPARLRASGEQRFSSPDDAVKTLVAAAQARDTNAMHAVFGPSGRELVSPDMVQASAEREVFMKRLTERTTLNKVTDSKIELQLGADAWPFPIPLVKEDNQWFFDTAAGAEEILNRRIGMNEIGAIQVCRAYIQAQHEYASEDYNDDGVLEYAQHLRSTPGAHDGLYWSAKDGEAQSPLGPLIAQAKGEGYRGRNKTKALPDDQSSPYHGYYFKILTRQGKHAAGEKYSYIINGHMVAGFALVAWPAEWGNSGVMTFLVSQQGKIYEKSLGPKTPAIASRMTAYDPDSSWTEVKEE